MSAGNHPKTVGGLHLGEWFTMKPIEHPCEKQVWIRSEYDQSERKYMCYRFDDINNFRMMDGNREVYTDFVF